MDVDALIKALTAPTITVGGKEYTGKILSLHQMLPLIKRFEDMGEAVGVEELALLLADVFASAGFPPEVAEQIPLAVMDDVLTDFFERQVAGGQNRATRRAMKSINSSPVPIDPAI
jgi:hypothetical protein